MNGVHKDSRDAVPPPATMESSGVRLTKVDGKTGETMESSLAETKASKQERFGKVVEQAAMRGEEIAGCIGHGVRPRMRSSA